MECICVCVCVGLLFEDLRKRGKNAKEEKKKFFLFL